MTSWRTLDGNPPRIIAHRGASGHRPEHTLEGYALALAQGADVIEPDLVHTRDGVAWARHDVYLSRSTDIAARPEFSSRARLRDGRRDWWIGDFDAADVETLRAIQPYPGRDRSHDGKHAVPRFSQVLDLAQAAAAERGRPVPVYPELKHPEYFHALGLDPVELVCGELAARNLTGPHSGVWLQCFDHAQLRRAYERCGNPCYALVDALPADAAGRARLLQELSGWARGIAPGKFLLWDAAGKDSGLVAQAHEAGLEVHSWTFREDAPSAPHASPAAELDAAFALGVDALFCDFPDAGLRVRNARR